ncbi:uncharacterized protein CLUP02_10467 [Colletotrichum lupini]|uniref:Uncharacterized protein n=1 Tax=Colletotrichum lupini TaxID=145971 RepID=A0A9Q8SYD1_9PEZI|nr:uncharacterized protein CLUP02_10467 [Colletotrichum lupini]UQC84971.1 hypothetical protein CLUP02_10467 [Colletotrichum lupini]
MKSRCGKEIREAMDQGVAWMCWGARCSLFQHAPFSGLHYPQMQTADSTSVATPGLKQCRVAIGSCYLVGVGAIIAAFRILEIVEAQAENRLRRYDNEEQEENETNMGVHNEYIAVCLPVKDSAMVVSLYPYIRIRIMLLIVMPESTVTAGRVPFFCSLVKDAWIESQSWRWWPASSNPAGEHQQGSTEKDYRNFDRGEGVWEESRTEPWTVSEEYRAQGLPSRGEATNECSAVSTLNSFEKEKWREEGQARSQGSQGFQGDVGKTPFWHPPQLSNDGNSPLCRELTQAPGGSARYEGLVACAARVDCHWYRRPNQAIIRAPALSETFNAQAREPWKGVGNVQKGEKEEGEAGEASKHLSVTSTNLVCSSVYTRRAEASKVNLIYGGSGEEAVRRVRMESTCQLWYWLLTTWGQIELRWCPYLLLEAYQTVFGLELTHVNVPASSTPMLHFDSDRILAMLSAQKSEWAAGPAETLVVYTSRPETSRTFDIVLELDSSATRDRHEQNKWRWPSLFLLACFHHARLGREDRNSNLSGGCISVRIHRRWHGDEIGGYGTGTFLSPMQNDLQGQGGMDSTARDTLSEAPERSLEWTEDAWPGGRRNREKNEFGALPCPACFDELQSAPVKPRVHRSIAATEALPDGAVLSMSFCLGGRRIVSAGDFEDCPVLFPICTSIMECICVISGGVKYDAEQGKWPFGRTSGRINRSLANELALPTNHLFNSLQQSASKPRGTRYVVNRVRASMTIIKGCSSHSLGLSRHLSSPALHPASVITRSAKASSSFKLGEKQAAPSTEQQWPETYEQYLFCRLDKSCSPGSIHVLSRVAGHLTSSTIRNDTSRIPASKRSTKLLDLPWQKSIREYHKEAYRWMITCAAITPLRTGDYSRRDNGGPGTGRRNMVLATYEYVWYYDVDSVADHDWPFRVALCDALLVIDHPLVIIASPLVIFVPFRRDLRMVEPTQVAINDKKPRTLRHSGRDACISLGISAQVQELAPLTAFNQKRLERLEMRPVDPATLSWVHLSLWSRNIRKLEFRMVMIDANTRLACRHVVRKLCMQITSPGVDIGSCQVGGTDEVHRNRVALLLSLRTKSEYPSAAVPPGCQVLTTCQLSN